MNEKLRKKDLLYEQTDRNLFETCTDFLRLRNKYSVNKKEKYVDKSYETMRITSLIHKCIY